MIINSKLRSCRNSTKILLAFLELLPNNQMKAPKKIKYLNGMKKLYCVVFALFISIKDNLFKFSIYMGCMNKFGN